MTAENTKTVNGYRIAPGSILRRAVLSHCNLAGCSLQRAKFNWADMTHADLSGAHLNGADFARANLQHSDLSGADLSNAMFEYADLRGATLTGCIINDYTVFKQTHITESQLLMLMLSCDLNRKQYQGLAVHKD